jgi:tetratricopeptide (TPR) repeat protein
MFVASRARYLSNDLFRAALGGLSIFFFLVLFSSLYLAAQEAGETGSSQNQGADQLTKTAESYEQFLRERDSTSSESRLQIQEKLGAVYFLLHRYRESLDVLTPILREQPGSASAKTRAEATSLTAQSWLVSGLDYLELNQLPDATRSLRHALSMQPGSANARMALGDALARSGHMEDAAKEYAEQAKLTPTLADAWYKLGLAHSQISAEAPRQQVRPSEQDVVQQFVAEELLAKGDTLNAARTLFRVARQSPDQPEVQAELGTALLTLGYVKAAQEHFQQELVKDPESPIAQLGLAQTAALNRNWTQVGASLERLNDSQPRELKRSLEFPPAGLVLQGWTGGQLKAPESFIQSPAGAIWKTWLSDTNVLAQISHNTTKDSAPACASIQSQDRDMRRGTWLTEQCYSSLERRLKAETNLSAIARAKLAEAEFRLGQFDDALHTAKRLRAADPQSGWAIYWMSKAHDALAEECFVKVGELNPDSPRVHQMLAERYLKLSDYPKAKAEFQSAIRLTPDSPDLHLGLGTVLSRTSDWQEAEKELKATLELAPQSDFARYELGHVYVQQGQWQQALEQLRQVPDSSTDVLSARLDLAKAESELGRTSDAVRDLLSVASLDQDGELYFRLAALYRSMGAQQRAHDAMVSFKQRRAASLQTDTEELGALEKEQEIGIAGKPQSP